MNRKKLYGSLLACFLMLMIPAIPSVEYNTEPTSKNTIYLNDGKNLSYAGEPIWIYDSDLYVKHVETADLNDDGINDVIAGEYASDYYDDRSKVIAIDGTDGSTLWAYDLMDGVRSMTLGDLNDDGVMDVIAGASKGSSTPDGRVHAIDGVDGSLLWIFTPGSSGDTIGDIAIGDFDGDMLPDVAIACWDDYVYAINGITGIEMWNTYIGSIFVDGVDTGDVNNDGIDDVSFANSYLAGFDNLQGVLNGTDGSTIWIQTVPYKVEETLLSDIDDDGILEAIFGVHKDNGDAEVHVRNASNGNLEWSYTIGPDIGLSPDVFLLSDDVDEDGDLDLVVGNEYVDNYVYLFDGDSSTPMWISEELDGFPRDLSSGDVIGDGTKNIIVATYDRVQVLNGNDGTKEWYYPVGGTILGVGCSDFDDDGVLDVVCSGGAEFTDHNPAKSVWALKTTEESPILWEFDADEYGSAVAIDDLNGDIYMDVIGVTSNDKAWAIDGENGEELWNWTSTDNLYSVTTGDFNDNGQIDVAVAGYDDIVTAFYGNNGTIIWQFTTPTDYIGRKCLKSTDLNNDGNIDVIAGSKDGTIYAINGNNGSELWSATGLGSINEVDLAQMDNYSSLDVVTVDGIKAIIINGSNGNILWSYDQNTAYAKHVEAFDVNNDSFLDVAIGVPRMGATSGRIIMVDGITHTEIWTVYPFLPCSDYGLAHGDLNDDGIQDLVAAGNYDDKKVHAFNGTNGNELWFFSTGGDVNVVEASDVNNDGKTEVIAGSDDQYLYVLWGSNGSILWNISTADDVIHLQIGDISGNGHPNIAVITFGFDGIIYAFKTLVKNQKPIAGFTCEPTTTPLTYETIYLNSTSYDPDGYIVNWTWTTDDGTTLYGENVTHQYSNDGIYNIILSVIDNEGLIDSNSLKVTVTNRPPTANFSYSPMNPTTVDTITFTDLSNDIDGAIVNWTWDLGDGNISYVQNPTHGYSDVGTYNVTLTVKDDDGSSNSTFKLITVLNKEPTADFTWTPTYPTDLEVIQFTSLSTDKAIVNWTWNFDDGNISYDVNPTHQYSDDGSYDVNLTVRDDDGASNSTTKQVDVSNVAPVANFSYIPANPTTASTITFTDSSYDLDGSIVNCTWDFNDGNVSYIQNPTHQYYYMGNYTAGLNITDDDGATDTIYQIINVSKGFPIADFTYSPKSPTIQDIIQFTDLSTDSDGDIVNWSWSFGDGNYSYIQNPTNQYDNNGTYLVNLEVTDDDDLSDNISKLILIGGTFVENLSSEWNFVSLPFNKSVNKTDLFVKYNGAGYNWTQATTSSDPILLSFIYDYNRTNQNYEGSLTFEPGRGYWLYAYYGCEIWILDIEIPQTDDNITTMEYSWNAMGIPADITINKTDLIIWYNGSEYNWTEATTGGDPILLSFIYDYNRTIQSYIDSSVLNPGRSYWMYAYYNCILFRPET